MNRNLGVERLYSLGDYKNLKVTDYINDLPEEVAMDTHAVDLIRYLQLVSVDIVYERYAELARKEQQAGTEKLLLLIEERANVMDELKTLLSNSKGE